MDDLHSGVKQDEICNPSCLIPCNKILAWWLLVKIKSNQAYASNTTGKQIRDTH